MFNYNRRDLILLSTLPTVIWFINGAIYFIYNTNPCPYFEGISIAAAAVITGYTVTFGYNELKWLSHKVREQLALCCFVNFISFFIYKEFRAETTVYLKIVYGVVEGFMVVNAVYFSPILLEVVKKNRANLNSKKKNWFK